jgi:hypothetical protein
MPVKDNILESLFTQSNFTNSVDDLKSFRDSLSQTILASKWLNYTTEITDPDIISKIEDKKITLSLKINNTCSNVCVLVDNIKLNKVCIDGEAETIRVDKSPGFELERIIDNKKSWIKNTTPVSRTFDIANNLGNNRIRQTEYNVNDERLVINTKEIDLDINLASAVEHDVWCYVVDNPCLLTGVTCEDVFTIDSPCCQTGTTCGDNQIDFDYLLTSSLSTVDTVEEFGNLILSELIDAKDRKTLSGYPTLRALYDRYLNSTKYCGTESSK